MTEQNEREIQGTKHSTLPWSVDIFLDGYHKVVGQPFVSGEAQSTHTQGIAFQIQHEADARYIVQACNAHDTMLDALEILSTWLVAPAFDAETIAENRRLVREAIALAEGEQ